MKKETSKKLNLVKIKIADLSQSGSKKQVSPTTTVLTSIKTLC